MGKQIFPFRLKKQLRQNLTAREIVISLITPDAKVIDFVKELNEVAHIHQ